MKLYHKQLKGVAHLRKEKKRLKIDSKVAVKNAEAVLDAKNADDPLASFTSLASDLMSSKGTAGIVMNLAMPLFGKVIKKGRKGIFNVAKEVLGGYIKWKAIDMGITLAKRFIKAQKRKGDKHY